MLFSEPEVTLEMNLRDTFILAKCLVLAKKSLESVPEQFQEGSDIDDIQELMKHPAFVEMIPMFEETYTNPIWETG